MRVKTLKLNNFHFQHAVESIRNRKSTTSQTNEFIQSLKVAQNNSGNFQAAAANNRQSIKRTPSNESSFVNKNGNSTN